MNCGAGSLTYIVMDSALLVHAAAHVEAMEEDAGDIECELGQIEHDADVVYEVDTFGASQALLGGRHALGDAGAAVHLGLGEQPLIGGHPPARFGLRRRAFGRSRATRAWSRR